MPDVYILESYGVLSDIDKKILSDRLKLSVDLIDLCSVGQVDFSDCSMIIFCLQDTGILDLIKKQCKVIISEESDEGVFVLGLDLSLSAPFEKIIPKNGIYSTSAIQNPHHLAELIAAKCAYIPY